MRALLSLILCAALAATPALADHVVKGRNHLPLVIPTGSPVRLAEISKDFSFARFEGTFVLTGTYHITRWATPSEAHASTEPYFEPDAEFVARLPYWQPYKQHASQITFGNPDDFLKAVLTQDANAKLNRMGRSTVSGRVTIKVSDFSTTVECDWPHFGVRFIAVERAPVLLASAKDDDVGC